jgi:hypothetical protein
VDVVERSDASADLRCIHIGTRLPRIGDQEED